MPVAKVYLVGAGPGHPGLLTLRAVECLRLADLVLYDKLVPAAALEHAPAHAQRQCVADLAPHHTERHRPIHETMIAAAKSGQTVVRLKGAIRACLAAPGKKPRRSTRPAFPLKSCPA